MSFTKYIVTYYEYDQDGNCKDGPKIFKEAFNSEGEAKNAIMKDMKMYKNSMKENADIDMIIDDLHIHDEDYKNGCIFNCIEINIDCGETSCSIH